MDTNGLKKFAQTARNMLIDQVTSKLDVVLADGAAARREHPDAIKDLESAIHKDGKRQVIEQVAYTWFNRFTALRFMDANGYTNPRIVSPADGATRPEILAEAMAGNQPEGAPAGIAALLDGRTPSGDPHAEAYRRLLVHACNHWHGPMPFLFEQIDDYTELLMPEDLLSQTSIIADLREVMTEGACQDVEIIGWLYQFYISEKKDQVFAGLKKNIKITAENIPAATQLFTPHWIVRYLVENSLGRLWLLNRPQSKLAAQMDYYIAPEEPETDFLTVARPEDIRICDPACGSGHMLTYAFDLLHTMYEEEGYEADKIPALILTHNLHGIEIDDRAGALAAFALAMKAAAKLGRRRFLRLGVQPNICVMQDVKFTPAEMQDVAAVVGRDLFTADLRETLGQFEQAKNFGSLIVPHSRDPAEVARVVRLKDFGGDLLLREVQERVLKVLEMAEALSPKYHVVVANPPYMGGKGMNGKLADFAKAKYPDSKSDLFAMFMERALAMSKKRGMMAMINMQSWMFLSSYEKLRGKLVSDTTLLSMAHLGERAFDTIGGAVVSTTAFVFQNAHHGSLKGDYVRLIDGSSESDKAARMAEAIRNKDCGWRFLASAEEVEKIPGSPIAYWLTPKMISNFDLPALSDKATFRAGLQTGDNDRFLRFWHEVSATNFKPRCRSRDEAKRSGGRWFPHNKGGGYRKWYGNNEYAIKWENDGEEIKSKKAADLSEGKITANNSKCWNQDYYFLNGLTWSSLSSNEFSLRANGKGFLFDTKGQMLFPSDLENIFPFLGLLNSKVASAILAALSPTLDFNGGVVAKLPLCNLSNKEAAPQRLRDISHADWDAYETSWDFTTLPLLTPEHRAETLAGSYTRLRAHWRGMTRELQRLEEENNRIFIDAYGLADELTPEVPQEEITLTCNPVYRYGGKATEAELEARLLSDTMAEFLHYAVGCMFGRYSLDAPGLILANQGEGPADYLARVPEPTFDVDADNVIPVLDGDWFADDITDRFRKFLRVTFGEVKVQENLSFIEGALGKDIRKWFTRDFFDYHVRRCKKRPIYWMFSSPKGSFNALIYMHRYRPDTVSVVLNDYLREFISKLQAERGRLEKLADDRNETQTHRTRAVKDVGAVIKQIAELEEWEREVVFPLAQAKIEIDLDDGVKRNYPLFGTALRQIKGLEAADE